jgi:hypothetical protein
VSYEQKNRGLQKVRSGKEILPMVFVTNPQVHVLDSFYFTVHYCTMKVEQRNQDSSVTIVTMLHAKNYLKFDSQDRQQIFLLAKYPHWH